MAGYEYDGGLPSNFSWLEADWIQPALTCPASGTYNADIWIGTGGAYGNGQKYLNTPMYQVGVKMDCVDGTSSVKAFWQNPPTTQPEQSFTYDHSITAGDKMVAYVLRNSDGIELDLYDYGSSLSQTYFNWRDTEQVYINPVPAPADLGSAECIVERHTLDSQGDLADFANVGTVEFSTASSASFNKACEVETTDQNPYHIISSSGLSWGQIYRDEMYTFDVDDNPLDLLASTTGQSSTGSFQVKWQASN